MGSFAPSPGDTHAQADLRGVRNGFLWIGSLRGLYVHTSACSGVYFFGGGTFSLSPVSLATIRFHSSL